MSIVPVSKLSLPAFLWLQLVLGLQQVLVNPAVTAQHPFKVQLFPFFKLLHVNHIDLLNRCSETNESRVTAFIGVATHRLSSVSLLAGLTDWTLCTRCAWSTR